MVIEKAKRARRARRDVVILLDSITGLRAPTMRRFPVRKDPVRRRRPNAPAARKSSSGGQNIEDGGSLTIIGTALVDIEPDDEVIRVQGTGTWRSTSTAPDGQADLPDRRHRPSARAKRAAGRAGRPEPMWVPGKADAAQYRRRWFLHDKPREPGNATSWSR